MSKMQVESEGVMKVEYINKRWINPKPLDELLAKLRYRVVGKLDEDNYIVRRNKPVPDCLARFYVFHISWGDVANVKKYKLFRVTI